MLSTRLFGIPLTVRLIGRCARRLVLADISLDRLSERIDRSYDRYRYLYIARRQKCLIRGLLLYFYAKRAHLDVRLIFGAADSGPGAPPKWHCWIALGDQVKFEVPDVIGTYTPFVEYR